MLETMQATIYISHCDLPSLGWPPLYANLHSSRKTTFLNNWKLAKLLPHIASPSVVKVIVACSRHYEYLNIERGALIVGTLFDY